MALNPNLATEVPQSREQAEAMILHLKDEVARIQNQIDDPQRKEKQTEREYATWRSSAIVAMRYKRTAIRHLSVWSQHQHPEDRKIRTYTEVARTLKFAALQYGKLIRVLAVAEEYINSTSIEEDERIFAELTLVVLEARKYAEVMDSDASVGKS
jgi:hypothetical protein